MFEYAAMNAFSLAWITVYLYEALLIVWATSRATGVFGRRKTAIAAAVFVAAYMVMKLFAENYMFWNMMGMIALISVFLLLFSDLPRLNAVWSSAVIASCIELGRLIVYGSVFIGADPAFYDRYVWPLRILAQLIKTALVFFCRKQISSYLEEKVSSVDSVLTSIAVFELIFMHMQRLESAAAADSLFVTGLASFLMLGLGVFAILFAVCTHVRSQGQERYMAKLREASRINYEQMQMKMEMDQEVRRMYHDLKHQLSAMHLPEVSEQLMKNAGYERMTASGNPLLDALLHQKAERAQSLQTALDLFVEQNDYSFIESMDLCSIFGNALDNALEACEKIPDPEKRWIRVKSALIGGIWTLKVENSCEGKPEKREGVYVTSKKDSHNHGIGIGSIRFCAEKYGGRADILAEETQFTITVTLPVMA